AVLYEMGTGRHAFSKALDWSLPPPAGVNPELNRIILKLLEPGAELRYQTAADVVADLKRLQRTLESMGGSRRGWLAAASVCILAAILAAAVIWVWTGRPPPGQNQWVQLTNLPDSVGQPALSPDGRMVTLLRGRY